LHPVVVDRDGDDRGAGSFENETGPSVSGIFHPDPIAGIDHQPRDQIDKLLRARQDHDLIGAAPHAARGPQVDGDCVAQGSITTCVAVREQKAFVSTGAPRHGATPKLGGKNVYGGPVRSKRSGRARHVDPEGRRAERDGPTRKRRRGDGGRRALERSPRLEPAVGQARGDGRPRAHPTGNVTLRRELLENSNDSSAGDAELSSQRSSRRQPGPRRQAPLEHGSPKGVVQPVMHRLARAGEVERKVEGAGARAHDKWSNEMM
jgi:hypothetical protein